MKKVDRLQEFSNATLAICNLYERHVLQPISGALIVRRVPLLTITALLAAFVLSACSSSGPSDDYLLSDFAQEGLSSIRITHKGECDPISPTARARGIDEAWLITFDYDSSGVGHIADYPELYVKVEGSWQRGSGYYDELGWPACP
jgi:hypothetical protein